MISSGVRNCMRNGHIALIMHLIGYERTLFFFAISFMETASSQWGKREGATHLFGSENKLEICRMQFMCVFFLIVFFFSLSLSTGGWSHAQFEYTEFLHNLMWLSVLWTQHENVMYLFYYGTWSRRKKNSAPLQIVTIDSQMKWTWTQLRRKHSQREPKFTSMPICFSTFAF